MKLEAIINLCANVMRAYWINQILNDKLFGAIIDINERRTYS